MPEVADLLGYTGQKRCQRVRRLFRRLESRDDASYLIRLGKRHFGVRLSSIERALPWSPGTLTAIRLEVNEIGAELSTVKKKVNGVGARVQKLEAWRRVAQPFLVATAGLLEDL